MANRPRLLIDCQLPSADVFERVADVKRFEARELTRGQLANADALLVRSVNRVDAELLRGTPVRFVGTATSGTDHVDVAYLKRAGITFADAKGANAPSVAQYVFACMALHTEKIKRPLESLRLGVVGFGHVGSLVGGIAADLGMSVIASDPPLEAKGFAGPWVPLPTLLATADIVSLHVPLESAGACPTVNLIGTTDLALMRAGAGLINTARGGVVNEADLRAALIPEPARISAYVDVWVGEPGIDIGLARLCEIATPHVAGYSIESKRRAVEALHAAFRSWLVDRVGDRPFGSEHSIPVNAIGEPQRFRADAIETFPVRTISEVFLAAAATEPVGGAFAACRRRLQARSEVIS